MTPARARILFAIERERFARMFPAAAAARLVLEDTPCAHGLCGYRNVAWTFPGDPEVYMLVRALALPEQNVLALFRHELGHLVDEHVHEPGAEQRADDLAEYVTGEPIRYDADDIETLGPGVYPRPLHLPR